MITGSKSDNTNVKYHSYFKKWEQFIMPKGGSALPASPIYVALYVTDLIDRRLSASVISATVYAIKWAHNLCNYSDPTDNMFIKNLLETAKRCCSKPTVKKEPVTSEMLIQLCNNHLNDNDLLVVRDLCMIVLSFAGFLRYDELSNLRCNDVKLFDSYFSLSLRKSKTDQYRFGKEVLISKGSSVACPYILLQKYLNLSEQNTSLDKYLFRPCFRSHSSCKLIYKDKPLSYTRARECLVSRLKEVAGNLELGLHSLRSGGATVAANSGVSDRCLMRHGRWKCESSKDGYIADSVEKRLEVSRSLDL